MSNLEKYYLALVVIQLLHSQEEIWMRFDKKWPAWKMSRVTFVLFEILFLALILSIFFVRGFPQREVLMLSFNILMFANGIWHLMWAAIEKRYVPGLITAPLFLFVFLAFYFQNYG